MINRRAGGCSSLLRGLDEVGFKVIERQDSTPRPADGAHIVVVAVSGVDDDACNVVESLCRDSTNKLPVLVISDNFNASVAEEYLVLGATDFLSQPSSGRVLRGWCERVLHAQQSEWLYEEYVRERRRSGAFDRVIVPLSLALFAERDYGKLLETILLEAKELCLADGGTLYIRTPDDTLEFAMVHNDTLGISVGGTKGATTTFACIPLFRASDGEPERRFIAAHVAHTGESVALPDLYDATDFDVSGSREFDARHGYRTRSVLAAPLKNEVG
ncbi:MAG: GAF domain-containing protein, partial [Candidatus Hydrogenedentota bacterium]